MDFLQLIGLIIVIYLAIYIIVGRICDCVERCTFAKHCMHDFVISGNLDKFDTDTKEAK